jgi:hypothetical protein
MLGAGGTTSSDCLIECRNSKKLKNLYKEEIACRHLFSPVFKEKEVSGKTYLP